MRQTLLIILIIVLSWNKNHAQMNVAKAGIGEILSLKPSLQYERVINERFSAQIALNFRPSVRLPSFLYNGMLNVSDNAEFKTSNFAFFPEVRYYTGFNLPPEGFYLALQGKFAKSSLELTGIMLDETAGEISGSIGNVGGGLQMGYQWLIKEKITVDFYFMGLTLQRTDITGTVTSDDPNANYTEMGVSLEESIEDVFFLHRLEVTTSPNSLKTELNALSLGVRTGVSIGIAF